MRILCGLCAAVVLLAGAFPINTTRANGLAPRTVWAVLPSTAIVIDDGDAGFQKFGTPNFWKVSTSTPNDYYGSDVTWTTNLTDTADNYARWSLPVTATLPMTYEVMAFVPRYNSSTQNARYVISQNGITTTKALSQNLYYAEWVSLGQFVFTTGTNYVELSDATGEPANSKRIGFDAVAFVPQQVTLPFIPTAHVALPIAINGGVPIAGASSTSRYIQTVNPDRHYRMGCEAGRRGESGVAVLAFGQPWAVDLGYGALIFGALLPSTMSQIAEAAKGFIRGYAECGANGSGQLQIGLGVNNYKGETNNGHGRAWGQMVNTVHTWLQSSPYVARVSVAGAADMEPGWNTASNTRAWVDGFRATAQRPLINFGSCDGCPTALNPTAAPNNGWTVEDVWYVSAASGGLALPEIYLRNGITADQWYRISLHGATQHGRPIEYAGALTQYAACQDTDPLNCQLNGTDNRPDQGLQQLNNAINADGRTAYTVQAVSDITWKQDTTLTAAKASRATAPVVAHTAVGNGYVVEEVQPPLPASAFIGGNMWLGQASGQVMQIYAGTVRTWDKNGDSQARAGLGLFVVQADGTIAPAQPALTVAPSTATTLRVTGAADGVLVLATDAGETLRFDLTTLQWVE